MNKILEKVNDVKKENQDIRVYLGASKNRKKFYQKNGYHMRRMDMIED